MITRERILWGRMFGEFRLPWGLSILATVTVVLMTKRLGLRVQIDSIPVTIMAGLLGVLLSLRNDVAYARWWEARILWGGLVNQSRNLARQMRAFAPEHVREMVHLQAALAQALRCHLRRAKAPEELDELVSPEVAAEARAAGSPPARLLLAQGDLVGRLRAGGMEPVYAVQLDQTLMEISTVLGGCERIKNTPLPPQYNILPRVITYGFVIALPFALVGRLGWWTMLLAPALAFVFLALEASGQTLEGPFENLVHDTPMTALARTIEREMRQAAGDECVPDPVEPKRGFLM